MKLLVCDVEGTIFRARVRIEGTEYPSTMWQPIAIALGASATEEERKTHAIWDSGGFRNYLEWVKATIDIHRKYSLKKEVFEDLLRKAEYNEGVVEFFEQLNRKEWIPVLISGGFQNLIRRAQNELDIEYGFGACEYFFDDYGFLEHYNLKPSDFEGKEHFLDTLLKTFRLNKTTDWVYIGDGLNDVHIAKKAPLAFGINPHDALKAVEGIIEISSFMDIIPHLEAMGEKIVLPPNTTPASRKMVPVDDPGYNWRIIELKRQVNNLKQKLNDQKGRKGKKSGRIHRVTVKKIDYENTSRAPLTTLLEGVKVVFLGLDEHREAFQRLEAFKGLRIVSGFKNNFDNQVIRNADFLFVYKNCISHSTLEHALQGANTLPTCFLLEPTNNELLENALANVLYRYIHQ